jgi:hypothetical protein
LRRDTIFRISSMTKPIAAAASMSLVDEDLVAVLMTQRLPPDFEAYDDFWTSVSELTGARVEVKVRP